MIFFSDCFIKDEKNMTGGTDTKTNTRSSEMKLQEVRKIFISRVQLRDIAFEFS
jgi:hypothetical protein